MSVKKGIYRISRVVKDIGRFVGLGFIFVLCIHYYKQEQLPSDMGLILLLVTVFVAITETVSWILDGFASE